MSPRISRSGWLSNGMGRLALGTALFAECASAQVTERVSIDGTGAEANAACNLPSPASTFVSEDGRWVVFLSAATNLVPTDANGTWDVFVRDRLNLTTELVSIDSNGVQGNGPSGIFGISISIDGRWVAFESASNNLEPGDTNGVREIFLRDRLGGTTERVALDSSGNQGNGSSSHGSMSADARWLAFASEASNLVPGDTNGAWDVFVRDRQLASTEIVSVNFSGIEGNGDSYMNAISGDGRFVAFTSIASNLVGADTNGRWDVFVRDRQNGTTQRVSIATSGVQGNGDSGEPSISADGRFVTFSTMSSNLCANDANGLSDVLIRDRLGGVTELISVSLTGAPAGGVNCSVSRDGRHVSFVSSSTNLIPNSPPANGRVFVRDLNAGTTELVGRSSDGTDPTLGLCHLTSISADGRYVAYESSMPTLVSGDSNGVTDVFISDRLPSGFTSLCDPGQSNVMPCPCGNPASSTGRGCENSAGTGGALLTAIGNAYLTIDSLSLNTAAERPTATSILLQGDAPLPNGGQFGQGVRCVGGNMRRLFVKVAANGSITAPDASAGDPTLSARSAALGVPLQPGQPYFYLVYYRDPIVLGGCAAGNTFNCTQTGSISWWP